MSNGLNPLLVDRIKRRDVHVLPPSFITPTYNFSKLAVHEFYARLHMRLTRSVFFPNIVRGVALNLHNALHNVLPASIITPTYNILGLAESHVI